MWKLKACLRCGGDVFVDWDQYGWYKQCLQCGYRSELRSTVEVRGRVGEGNLKQAKGTSRVK